MKYLDENLNALKIRNENLYNKVREYVDNTEIDYSNFSIIDTRDGNAIVVINRSGKEIRLNSIYNAEKEASHWVKQFDFSNILLLLTCVNAFFNTFFTDFSNIIAVQHIGPKIVFQASITCWAAKFTDL